MTPYLNKALRRFDKVILTTRQQSPYPHVKPNYGAKQQFAKYDKSNPINDEKKKQIQKGTGNQVYCQRIVGGGKQG
jgi:hypothetical protein